MADTQDRLLSNAGGLLMAAGCLAAFTGGMYGLAHTEPGLVVLSVLLLIGYGVVGYLLMTRGAAHFQFVLPASAVLVLLTLFVLRTDKGGFLASVAYLFQFMLGGGDAGLRYFGEFLSLLGLILTGLPIAISAVGWIQMNAEEPQQRDEPPAAPQFVQP